jgi:hypothetical protein
MYVGEYSVMSVKVIDTMIAVTARCSTGRVGRVGFLHRISGLGDYFRRTVTIFLIVITAPLCAQRPAITGISHVVFYADDMAQSVTFYEQLLGWKYVPAGVTNNAPRFYANPRAICRASSTTRRGTGSSAGPCGLCHGRRGRASKVSRG